MGVIEKLLTLPGVPSSKSQTKNPNKSQTDPAYSFKLAATFVVAFGTAKFSRRFFQALQAHWTCEFCGTLGHEVSGSSTNGKAWWFIGENGGKTPWDGGPSINPIYTLYHVGIWPSALDPRNPNHQTPQTTNEQPLDE